MTLINWTFFLIRPKGLNFFYWLIWPKGLFFLIWVTESNTFLNTKELNLLLFSWHKELNLFEDYLTPRFKTFVNREMELFEFGSRNWGLFNNITQKWLTLFGHDSQSWTFFQHDSQNWTLLKKTWFIEIEPFFTTWLENESFFSMTSRDFFFDKMYDSIKLIVFGKYDSKNWNFC